MARVSRRTILKAGAVAASAVAMPHILTGSPLQAARRETEEAKGTVTFWTTNTVPDLTTDQAIVKKFNETHKGVKVKLVQVPTTATNDTSKLLTAVRGGTGPDVYHLDRFTVTQEAAAGVLEDLTKYGAPSMKKNYLDYAWAEVEFQGKPYALPRDTDARGLMYNKTILSDIGVSLSQVDPNNGPITTDQFLQINQKANTTGSNGNYTRVGAIPWFDQGETYTWGWIFGGNFVNVKKCEVTPTNSGVVKGLQYIYDWSQQFGASKLASFISAYAPTNAPPATYPLFQGRTAFSLTGDWQIATAKEYVPSLQYGYTYLPVPKAGDKPTTWSGGFSVVMPTGAKNPDGAWEFMKYIAGEPGQLMYTTQTTHMPTLKSLLAEKKLFPGAHAFFTEKLLPITRSRPPLPVGSLYWDQLQDAESSVQLNQKQPMPALQAAASATNPQLKQYCPL